MKTYDELVSLFEEANLAFLQAEHSLFRTEVAERTLCGVLMLHIHDIIKEDDSYSGYYADVEYNRNAGGIKTIRKTTRGQQEEIIPINCDLNQRIIAENAQFTGIAAGQGVGFTTGLLHLRKGLGMRETPIRPHSWHCRMQSDYQYDGNRKRPPVWRRHRGSLRPRGRNLGRVEGMTGSCGSGCDPAIHARRLRVYHRPRRLRMASRISIFFAARRFEPLNSMG